MSDNPPDDKPPGRRKPLPNGKPKTLKEESSQHTTPTQPVIQHSTASIRHAAEAPALNPSATQNPLSTPIRLSLQHESNSEPALPKTARIRLVGQEKNPTQVAAQQTTQSSTQQRTAPPKPKRIVQATPDGTKYRHDKTPGKRCDYQKELRSHNEWVVCDNWKLNKFMDAVPENLRPSRDFGNTGLQYLYNLSNRIPDLAAAQKLMCEEYEAHPKRDGTFGIKHLKAVAQILKHPGGVDQDDVKDEDYPDDEESSKPVASNRKTKGAKGRGIRERGPRSELQRHGSRSLARGRAPPAPVSMVDDMRVLADSESIRPAALNTREVFPEYSEFVARRDHAERDRRLANESANKLSKKHALVGVEKDEGAAAKKTKSNKKAKTGGDNSSTKTSLPETTPSANTTQIASTTPSAMATNSIPPVPSVRFRAPRRGGPKPSNNIQAQVAKAGDKAEKKQKRKGDASASIEVRPKPFIRRYEQVFAAEREITSAQRAMIPIQFDPDYARGNGAPYAFANGVDHGVNGVDGVSIEYSDGVSDDLSDGLSDILSNGGTRNLSNGGSDDLHNGGSDGGSHNLTNSITDNLSNPPIAEGGLAGINHAPLSDVATHLENRLPQFAPSATGEPHILVTERDYLGRQFPGVMANGDMMLRLPANPKFDDQYQFVSDRALLTYGFLLPSDLPASMNPELRASVAALWRQVNNQLMVETAIICEQHRHQNKENEVDAGGAGGSEGGADGVDL